MAVGSIYIRRNNADTSVINIGGGANEDAGWDTLHFDDGGIGTYTDPNIQLDTGLYLIMYSEQFVTTDTTTNERIEIQGEIHTGAGVQGGYGSDYIRKTSGHQECSVQGQMILDITADNTDVFIRFYRTDDSTIGTVNRLAGFGGVTILQLDDATHNFGLYSSSSSEVTSGTAVRTLITNTNDKQDTGFSNSSGIVTITSAGRYFATYSLDISIGGTGRETMTGFIEKNSTTEVIGTRGFCFVRGNDSTQDSAITWAGIIDVADRKSVV